MATTTAEGLAYDSTKCAGNDGKDDSLLRQAGGTTCRTIGKVN